MAKKITMPSKTSTRARRSHAPQPIAARSRVRASPTVTTEPVTRTPAPPKSPSSSASADGRVDRVVEPGRRPRPGRRRTPPRRSRRARRPASPRRGVVWVTTTSASTGSSASSMPRDVLVGHRGDHADQPGEAKDSPQRRRRWPAPRPGCARRRARTVGRAPDDLEPARRGRRRRTRPAPGRRPAALARRAAAEERLDRRERAGRVVRLVRTVQRQEDVVVLPAEPAQGRAAARRRRASGTGRRTPGPRGPRSRRPRRRAAAAPRRPSSGCWASTPYDAGLMIPAFSPAISVDRRAEVVARGRARSA